MYPGTLFTSRTCYIGEVKRKPTSDPVLEPILNPRMIDDSDVTLEKHLNKSQSKARKCEVCSELCTPNSTDELCWVCKRLKLSAWRDTDTQMPAQE